MQKNIRISEHPLLDIQKGRQISFQFNGRTLAAYEGESIAAALYASGVRIFSRSFKYHRPRGLFCMTGHCSNCLMRVDGVPNVRVCREPVREGVKVQSQNAWPSLNFDLAALTGYVSFLVRPGFQYRRFIRPRWAYHIWEKILRRMAGIGTLADAVPHAPTVHRTASPEIMVVGGGMAGLAAAVNAAEAGAVVWLVEREDELGGRARYDTAKMKADAIKPAKRRMAVVGALVAQAEELSTCRIMKNSTAIAWYDEDVLAVSGPGELWELKPGRVIVAAGSYETPMVFENNDLPGIFSMGALQRLMHGDFIRPGQRAVAAVHVDEGYTVVKQMLEAGVAVAGIVDSRERDRAMSAMERYGISEADVPLFSQHTLKGAVGRRGVRGVRAVSSTGDKIKLSCDTLCIAGARTPASELLFQRTCAGTYVLESPHQFTRKPVVSRDMHVGPATDMFAAGQACGSRGAEIALIEGKVAGLSAALELGHGNSKIREARDLAMQQLVKRRAI